MAAAAPQAYRSAQRRSLMMHGGAADALLTTMAHEGATALFVEPLPTRAQTKPVRRRSESPSETLSCSHLETQATARCCHLHHIALRTTRIDRAGLRRCHLMERKKHRRGKGSRSAVKLMCS